MARAHDGDAARFWGRVPNRPEDGCWVWGGYTGRGGYGQIRAHKTRGSRGVVLAHRFAYLHSVGDIPDGMLVCHHCDNRACVRPSHLFLGTHKDNTQDAVRKKRMARRERNPKAKIAGSDIPAMRAMRLAGMSFAEIGSRYGITGKHAAKVLRGEFWAGGEYA